MENKKRYAAIDLLKFLLAYTVMIYHINMNFTLHNQLSGVIAYIVGIAVPYFFVVSGFFLFEKINQDLAHKKTILLNYAKKIWLMYISWTLIMLPFRIPEVLDIGFNVKAQLVYWAKYIRVVLFIGEYQLWYLIGLLWALIIFYICFKKIILKNVLF